MTKDDDDPKSSTVDAWVAAFKDKVRQIERAHLRAVEVRRLDRARLQGL